MALELVLLSEVPLTEEVHHRAYKRLGMTGEMLELLDGQVSTLHDETGRHVLTVHAPMVIHDAREAAAALVDPPGAFGLWSDIMVPFDNTEKGRTVAEAIAAEIGGLIRERI